MKKFALITGASGGIGQAVSVKLAEEGYSLYLHYNHNMEGINRLLDRLQRFGGEYIPIQADLSVPGGYKKLFLTYFHLMPLFIIAEQLSMDFLLKYSKRKWKL